MSTQTGHVDHRRRVRQGRPVGLRGAGADQGAHQVTSPRCGRWLGAIAHRRRGGRGSRRAGVKGQRDVRRRLDHHPRLALRSHDERRGLAGRQGRARAARGARADATASCATSSATCSAASGCRTSPSSPRAATTRPPRPSISAATRASTFVWSVRAARDARRPGRRRGRRWRASRLAAALARRMPVAELLSRLPETMPVRLRKVEIWRMVETRLRGPQGSLVPLMFDDGVSDVGVDGRPARGIRTARDGRQPADDVRARRERGASDATRREGGRDSVQRLDAGCRSPLPAGRRQVSRRERHRRRSARQPGRAGGDDHGHLAGTSSPSASRSGSMKTRDAELRFAANPRLVNARRRSASSRMPGRSPSSSTR